VSNVLRVEFRGTRPSKVTGHFVSNGDLGNAVATAARAAKNRTEPISRPAMADRYKDERIWKYFATLRKRKEN